LRQDRAEVELDVTEVLERPQQDTSGKTLDFDVLIIGAGISGIGSAYHLKTQNPDKSFAILEAKDDIGGTRHTHKYPGVPGRTPTRYLR